MTPTAAPPRESDAPSLRTIAVATAVALVVALVLLLTVILPAEYGIDPIGTGRALGLSALAETGQGAISPADGDHVTDAAKFVLGPFEWVEYKYRLEEGAGMLFAWQATDTVRYDFHGEPDAGPEYAESFESQDGSERRGTFTAPFSGIHGWYWQNRTTHEVTVTIKTAGFYTATHEFFDGGMSTRTIGEE